jgi:hypothetical protein
MPHIIGPRAVAGERILAGYPGHVPAEDDARARYEDLVDELVGIAGVTPPRGGSGFGRGALRYRGKIFAMLVRGRLVLKLPDGRVSELCAAGEGVHFDANKGTPMREWLSLDPGSGRPWLPLAREALDFAQAGPERADQA